MKTKVDAACAMLKEQGHSVEAQVRGEPVRTWFEVDRRILVSWEEMQELADGVYSLTDLEDLYRRRQADERAGLE
ncbi:MAG TPA: hypothetical protein VHX36_02735 [Candidatus Acidoferrales bacterium]|jgi:hypothetical protein|nr:hypothetical protein [Candidatus Acidoferrales bacterium]